MLYRFLDFELDTVLRELRKKGVSIPLQPQVLELLAYLAERRDRVVPKEELLTSLWPDSVVLEASLQRAISQARSALGEAGHEVIRTYSRHGYRFVADVECVDKAANADTKNAGAEPLTVTPKYVLSDGAHIAYSTLGAGSVDIVLVFGWAFPMRAALALDRIRQNILALTRLGRVVLFDKRGTGLSDRVKQLPSLDGRMNDLRAVLDEIGSRQAVLCGYSEGGPLAISFAAAHPERVRGLLLIGAFARMMRGVDYAHGLDEQAVLKLEDYIRKAWGRGTTMLATLPKQRASAELTSWAAQAEQDGGSPGAALDLLEMNRTVDVRCALAAVRTKTVVLHHTGDRVVPASAGRYLAEQIADAELIELPGDDHLFAFDDSALVFQKIEELLKEAPSIAKSAGFLAAVLAIARREELPQPFLDRTKQVLAEHGALPLAGRLGGAFSSVDQALACALAIQRTCFGLSAEARTYVHIGEVSRTDLGVVGAAADIAAELAVRVPAGQIWTSHLVPELLPQPKYRLEPAGVLDPERAFQCFPLATD